MLKVLTAQASVFDVFLAELRSVEIQKDPLRFRRNIERMGELFAYEISKGLAVQKAKVQTPLGEAESIALEGVVLGTVLRAGLPLHQGLLNIFDRAENAFISAYRDHSKGEDTFEVKVEYLAAPSLEGKTVILADPMLATGASMLLAHKALLTHGNPKHIHLVSVIASQAAVDHVMEQMKDFSFTLWVGAIDEELDEQSYIVPGLGDAGDLSYGQKL